MNGFRLPLLVIAALFLPGISYSQSDATLEADRWFRRADADLNRIYQQIHARLKSPRARNELAKAQRAWIVFRDSESAFRAGLTSGGGSAYSLDVLANRAELTEQRTKQLKALLPKLP